MQDPKRPQQADAATPSPDTSSLSVPHKNTAAVQTPPYGTEPATLLDGPAAEPATMAEPATALEAATSFEVSPGGQGAAVAPAKPASKPPSSWGAFLLPPRSVLGGRYEIIEILGEGGMGAVYKARDREVERTIALKVIRSELANNPEILQRFKQELILARQITDRNIIRIFDVGEAGGIRFITMEYVEGQSLYQMLRERGRLPLDEVVDIMEQVFSGLRAAHREGVIHRDLKPGNIMLDKQGRVVIMDFGLARTMEGDGMTRTGAMLGTMEYMSPEQAQARDLDARSDIFTMGLICYELLSGKMPFHAESAVASLLRRTRERAVPISEISRGIPVVLSNIVSKCLERDPGLRYQSAQAVLDDLHAWQGKGARTRVSATGSSLFLNRAREFPWKRTTVAALAIVVALTATWYLSRRGRSRVAVQHTPLSVLVADFQNNTSDTLFDGTLEPMIDIAMEGASFINAYNRGTARRLAAKLPDGGNKLDEKTARLVAVSQGLSAIVTGSLSSDGGGYRLSVKAIDTVTGKTLATSQGTAGNKDEVLLTVPKVVAPIRKALGDSTPESVQLAAERGGFTVSNLEAVHQYGVGMEQQSEGKMQDALQSFSKAAESDPNFARAYAGMAAVSRSLGKTDDAEKYVKLALVHVDRMSERERFRIRGLYYVYTGDLQKCVEEYSALVKAYPSDNLGHNNLSVCYADLHNYPKAIEELQAALQTTPNSAMYHLNISILSTYTSDFEKAEQEARVVLKSNPSFEVGYMALAYAQLGQGHVADAIDTYQSVAKASPLGASMSASGLADVALYEGRLSDAARILESGAAADVAAKNSRAAEKFVVLAETQLLRGDKHAALQAAGRALLNTDKVNVRFLAARVLISAGDLAKARKLSTDLASNLDPEAQVDSKLIDGEIALQAKDARNAIQSFTEANARLGTWVGWFDLGRAYLEAGLNVQADSEFDRCLKGRGEAMELLDGPTYGYFPQLYYYIGRTEEGLGSPGAAESYQKFLSIQQKGDGAAMFVDAKRRLAELGKKR